MVKYKPGNFAEKQPAQLIAAAHGAIQLSLNDAKRLPFANLDGIKHSAQETSQIIINRPTAHAYNLTPDKLII